MVPVEVSSPAKELSRSVSMRQISYTIIISARIHIRKAPKLIKFLKQREIKSFTAQITNTVVFNDSIRFLLSEILM